MRDLNLILELKADQQQAISRLEENIRVYKSKLMSQESRKDFRRQKRKFECFRRRFYRDLTEGVAVPHTVSKPEIQKIWETIWTNRQVDESLYNEYLEDYIPNNHPATFPSEVEFIDIVKFLPNWKAA